MKENPANAIKDTMWKFLMDKGQKSNIPALKEYVYDLIQMTTQKTAGQRKAKDHISWDELDMTIMSIVIEATALVLSGDLDKKEANKDMNASTNASWIPVDRELPPNAKHKGALCLRYQVMTKYGVTEGWYNPDLESWYVLCWFIGVDYLETEIDFEKGTYPKVVRCENLVNDKHSIVLAWQPLPEIYRPERRDKHDGESSFN